MMIPPHADSSSGEPASASTTLPNDGTFGGVQHDPASQSDSTSLANGHRSGVSDSTHASNAYEVGFSSPESQFSSSLGSAPSRASTSDDEDTVISFDPSHHHRHKLSISTVDEEVASKRSGAWWDKVKYSLFDARQRIAGSTASRAYYALPSHDVPSSHSMHRRADSIPGLKLLRTAASKGGRLSLFKILTFAIIVSFTGVAVIFWLFLKHQGYHFDSPSEAYGLSRIAGAGIPALSEAERNDRTFDEARCQREFPALYPQLEDLKEVWRKRGGIKQKHIDASEFGTDERWGYARLIIKDGQMFVRSFVEGTETRVSALVHLLHAALLSAPAGSSMPPLDMIVTPADKDGIRPEDGTWAVTKRLDAPREKGVWLLPDFGFAGWPEAGVPAYEEFFADATKVESKWPWERKGDKAFWRGFANWYPTRRDLLERTDAKDKPSREIWADVKQTSFHHDTGSEFVPLVAPADHCKQKYLIHTEGNSYSGRSKFLLSCRSVVIAHPLEWTQHFHPALDPNATSPDQNFIQLPGPYFQGLEQTMAELWESDGKSVSWDAKDDRKTKSLQGNSAQHIADNQYRIMAGRYLTPAATMCYTRSALKAYALSQNLQSWGTAEGPQIRNGSGIVPGTTKGSDFVKDGAHGDIEAGLWRLVGSPEWPPVPEKKKIKVAPSWKINT